MLGLLTPLLITVAVGLAMRAMTLGRAPRGTPGVRGVTLRTGWGRALVLRVIGGLGIAFVAAMGWLVTHGSPPHDRGDWVAVGAMTVGFLGGAAFLLNESRGATIELLPQEMRLWTPWRSVVLRYEAITEIRFGRYSGLVIRGRGGEAVRASLEVGGLVDLAQALLDRAPAPSIDVETRDVLERWSRGEVPPT